MGLHLGIRNVGIDGSQHNLDLSKVRLSPGRNKVQASSDRKSGTVQEVFAPVHDLGIFRKLDKAGSRFLEQNRKTG